MFTITETMLLEALERVVKELIPHELIEHLVSREIRQHISTIALEDAAREQGWELRSFRRLLARKGVMVVELSPRKQSIMISDLEQLLLNHRRPLGARRSRKKK